MDDAARILSTNSDVTDLKKKNRPYIIIPLVVTFLAVGGVVAGVTAVLTNYQTALPATSGTRNRSCGQGCVFSLVESIPFNVSYPNGSASNPSVYSGWVDLLEIATETIDIASSYWSLRGSDTKTVDNTTFEGEDIYKRLLEAGTKRGIKIRVVQTLPSKEQPSLDTIDLSAAKAIQLRSLNFSHLIGNGILHTKMWLVDGKHFYVGSANLDWRSLTQVKEMGAITYNCSCLASDMAKIFEVYWTLGSPGATVPKSWPSNYTTDINKETPLILKFSGTGAQTYLASSPPEFCPHGRTGDIDAILSVINRAKKFINIAVMDYFPTTIYQRHNIFWPVIDDALKTAAFRGVHVSLLCSWWSESRGSMPYYMLSLKYFSPRIQVRLFEVPQITPKIPYTRVNHNKYMVTEDVAYIGTSNWSADYFINTGGIGYVVNQTEATNGTIHAQLLAVFQRDWSSQYSHNVTDYIKH